MTIIVVFAACGFCGVSAVAALTKRFGALVAAITTTARKALTLVLSFVFFPKPFLPGHLFGIVLFVAGLVFKSKVQAARHPRPQDLSKGEVEVSAGSGRWQAKGSGGGGGQYAFEVLEALDSGEEAEDDDEELGGRRPGDWVSG